MAEVCGWMGTILRVDLTKGEIVKEPFTEELRKDYIELDQIDSFKKYGEESKEVKQTTLSLNYAHGFAQLLKMAKDFNVHQGFFVLVNYYTKLVSKSTKYIFVPVFDINYQYSYLTINLTSSMFSK